MSFEEELVDMLQADASILATVGDRVWPVAIREKPSWPALTYARNGGIREYVLDASLARQTASIILRCWAKDYPAARALADDCAAALALGTSAAIDLVTISDGPDVWLDGHDVFGCSLLVDMELLP